MTEPLTKPTRPPRRPPPPPPRKQAPVPPPQWAKPTLGLAKPEGSKPKIENQTGGWASSKTERGYERDEGTGKVTGTKSSTKSEAGTGAKTSTKTESDVFDGATRTQTGTKVEGLAGAEAAVKIISMATDDELSIAIEAMARAGAFGSAEANAAIQRGRAGASAKGKASGGMGIEGKMSAETKVDRSGLIPALEATFEASIRAGIWGEAEAEIEAHYGPLVAKAVAKIEGFIGVAAEVSAKAFASWKEGIGAEFSAGVRAEASSSGSITATLVLGPAELEVGAGYHAWAGAKAELEGSLTVSLDGVSASFKASAFAGAKVEAHGNAKIKLRGKTIVSAKGKVGVAVGAGVEIGGEFEIKNGKLKIAGELAAALKGGVTAGGELEIDFRALAEVIIAEIGDLAKADELQIRDASPSYERKPLTDPVQMKKKQQAGYDAVIDDFRAYGRKKMMGGDRGIKKERVQEIIQLRAGQLHEDFAYVETDRGIEQAAREAFGPLLKSIYIQAGYIRAFDPSSAEDAEKTKADIQQKEQWRAARDGLADDLRKYGELKAKSGDSGIKQENVQNIVNKHWKKVQAAFPGPEADQVVVFAAKVSIDKYLSAFEVSNGQITKFVAPSDKATGVKKEASDSKEEADRKTALTTLRSKLTAYRSTLITKPKKTIVRGDLQKLITESLSAAKVTAGTPEFDAELTSAITDVLAPIVETGGASVMNGQLTSLTPKAGGLDEARKAKSDRDQKNLQTAATTTLTTSLEGYKETKTKRGAAGIKREEVQTRITRATGNVRTWATSGDADEQIKEVALEALAPMLKSIDISQGQVVAFDAPGSIAQDEKRNRRENGKAILGGEEDDNQRRRLVSDAVGGEFAAYAAQVRAAAEKATSTKPAKVKLERGRLQTIIDTNIKKVRADVVNQVGDEAIETAARDKFGPMLKTFSVQNARITSMEPDVNFVSIAKAKRESSAQLVRAQSDLTSDLETYASEAAGSGLRASKSVVQAIIDKHKPKFGQLEEEEADTMITMAVTNAFGEQLRGVTIVGGTLHFFLLHV